MSKVAILRAMRIGMFTDYYLPHMGGTETSIYHQKRALEQAGHRVYIITPPSKGPQTEAETDIIRLKNWPITPHNHGLGVYIANPMAFKRLDTLNLDVVHVQTEFGIGLLGLKYARSRQKPLLYTAHTFHPTLMEQNFRFPRLSALGPAALYAMRTGRRPRHLGRHDHPADFPNKTPAERAILRFWIAFAAEAPTIIAPSKRMREFLLHYLPEATVMIVPNPYETPELKPSPRPHAHDRLEVVWAGHIAPHKRPGLAVQAVAALPPDIQEGLRVTIYGRGPEVESLRRSIAELGVQDSVRLGGYLSKEDMQTVMAGSDALLITSHNFDNQPMLVPEALHAGLVIVYSDAGLREGLTPHNALLVDPTPQGFASGLECLVKDSKRLKAMQRATAEQLHQFDYKTFVQRYTDCVRHATDKVRKR